LDAVALASPILLAILIAFFQTNSSGINAILYFRFRAYLNLTGLGAKARVCYKFDRHRP